MGNYYIVNRYTSFEIWKAEGEGPDAVSFLVKYELPFHKNIKLLRAKFWDRKAEALIIIVATQCEAATWIFTESEGLLKHSTITNCYDLMEFTDEPNSLITLREGYQL